MAYALPIATIALTLAGTAVAYAGAQQQKKAAQQAGEYNKAVSEVNAKTAQQQAAYAAEQKREQYMRVKSSQIAGFSKGGITLDDSAIDVMSDSVMSGELDALAEEYKGKVGANRYKQEGALSLMESSSRAKAYGNQATGTLLTGATRAAGQVSDFPTMEGY